MRRGVLSAIFGGAFLLGAAALWWESTSEKYAFTGTGTVKNAVFYPRILLIGVFILATVVVVRGLVRRGEPVERSDWLTLAGMVVVTSAYTLLLPQIGFLFSSVLFVAVLPVLLGYRHLFVVLPLAVIFPSLTWYIFWITLKMSLPKSPWFDWM